MQQVEHDLTFAGTERSRLLATTAGARRRARLAVTIVAGPAHAEGDAGGAEADRPRQCRYGG